VIYLFWAVLLVTQSFAFTFVSRARNSGSLSRHLIASVASNGIWFMSQMVIFKELFDFMTGKHGLLAAVGTAVFYTVFTAAGALIGHWWSLRSEKGNAAVGANKKYVQITTEEWKRVIDRIESLEESKADKQWILIKTGEKMNAY
jgi:hypothetical protein